jgi:hypothetical protein
LLHYGVQTPNLYSVVFLAICRHLYQHFEKFATIHNLPIDSYLNQQQFDQLDDFYALYPTDHELFTPIHHLLEKDPTLIAHTLPGDGLIIPLLHKLYFFHVTLYLQQYQPILIKLNQ